MRERDLDRMEGRAVAIGTPFGQGIALERPETINPIPEKGKPCMVGMDPDLMGSPRKGENLDLGACPVAPEKAETGSCGFS
jgi:hypothetical protein